ncbi:MAG: SDR family oxidoreductase [Saprospiraceae bacterium]|nr:SDR family oxidoreductase [Saprospiraceae bacterium]
MLLEGKNIIVIGGSGGLGEAAVHLFIQQGARVFATGYDTWEKAKDFGANLTYATLDATRESAVSLLIPMAEKAFGPIHGLYHIAGGSGRKMGDGPLHQLTTEGWDYTLDLNLRSVMLTNKTMIQYWLDNNLPGTILNMGSVLAFSPSAHYFASHAYAAAKAGIEGFSKSIAAFYASRQIRVNVLAPGLIATAMSARAQVDSGIREFIKTKQPLNHGRIGKPEDCSGAALFFMSDLSSFVTGEVLHIDGGWHLSDGQFIS